MEVHPWRYLQNHQGPSILDEWDRRGTYGQLVRDNKKDVLRLIKGFWKAPTSTKIEFLLDVLNRADPKREIGGKWTTTNCDRCGWHCPQTTIHRLTCPVNADLLNEADRDILECLVSTQPHDPEVDSDLNNDENLGRALGTDSIEREANENLHKLLQNSSVRIHNPATGECIPYPTAAKLARMLTLTQRERGNGTNTQHLQNVPLEINILPNRPWYRVAFDLCLPLPYPSSRYQRSGLGVWSFCACRPPGPWE